MRKILLVLIIICTIICSVFAVEPRIDTLSKVENAVLGITYSDQKLETRLNRLEEYLYGKVQAGNSNSRVAKILQTTKYSLLEEDTTVADNTFEVEPFDDSVDYPVLDDVEKRLNIPSKTGNNLNTRLSTIEKKIFNTVHNNEDFFTRVERIKSKVYGNMSLAENSFSDGNSFDTDFEDNFSPKSFFDKGSPTVRYKLSLLEQRLLKNTYGDETNNDRLARLENAVFETEFYNDNESERLNRLESVLKAKKSAPKYDTNKFQQGLSTAMQVGAMVLMVLAFIL